MRNAIVWHQSPSDALAYIKGNPAWPHRGCVSSDTPQYGPLPAIETRWVEKLYGDMVCPAYFEFIARKTTPMFGWPERQRWQDIGYRMATLDKNKLTVFNGTSDDSGVATCDVVWPDMAAWIQNYAGDGPEPACSCQQKCIIHSPPQSKPVTFYFNILEWGMGEWPSEEDKLAAWKSVDARRAAQNQTSK